MRSLSHLRLAAERSWCSISLDCEPCRRERGEEQEAPICEPWMGTSKCRAHVILFSLQRASGRLSPTHTVLP